MNCEKCGGTTKPKSFTSKAGKLCSGFECTSGCKNQGTKYPYFFFPPKEKTEKLSPQPDETIALLSRINAKLDTVLTMLKEKKEPVSDLTEEAPF